MKMKLRVIITETREIEVDNEFIVLFRNDEDEKAIKMVEENVGLKFGDKNTKNKPFIYCVETEEEEVLYEW